MKLSAPRIVALGLLILSSAISFAKPPFLKVFLDTYKVSPTSELGKMKCLACHLPPAPPKRNPYGLAVQAAMETAHSRMLTPEILKTVEKKDSDGDTLSNLSEIRAGFSPGDKNSKPPKPAKATKTEKGHKKVRKHRGSTANRGSAHSAFGAGLAGLSLIGLAGRSPRRRF